MVKKFITQLCNKYSRINFVIARMEKKSRNAKFKFHGDSFRVKDIPPYFFMSLRDDVFIDKE